MNLFEETWSTLGIAATSDKLALRRAYTARLKVTNPEDDPEGFKKLREAYEFALRFGDFGLADAADDEAPREEPSQEPVPEQKNPGDPASAALEVALMTLATELRKEGDLDAPKAQEALEKILDPACLERLDLLQRVDESLAELLATSIPRSDPLLAFANERLEWADRERDVSLSPLARRIVSRVKALNYSEQLQSGMSDEAAAWTRLAAPPVPELRWIHAYVLHHSSWPELTLIHQLEDAHPELLAQLNSDNVSWWRRFEERPHVSGWMVCLWIALSACVGVIGYASGDSPPDSARWYAGFFYSALGFALLELLRIYAIEWPIILSERHWGFLRPAWLQYGWIAASVLLLALGVMVRGIPWLAWVIAAGAIVTLFWATIAAGPVRPISQREQGSIQPMHSRLFRMVFINLFAGGWLILVARSSGDQLGWPLIVTIAAVLCASGVGRELQISGFASALSPQAQRSCCGIAIAVALVLGFFVLVGGDDPTWQPVLLVAVLGCTLLRRAAPVDLQIPEWFSSYGWLSIILIANVMRHLLGFGGRSSPRTGETDPTPLIMIGSLVFLGGVLFAAALFLNVLSKASRQVEEPS